MVFVGIDTADRFVAEDFLCRWIVRAEVCDGLRLVDGGG
jgi:hypothetical protein